MNEINIYKFDNNIKVHYTKRKVSLPKNYCYSIEEHWESILKAGKKFFRGDVFTITNIGRKDKDVIISVEQTDYAHFLYTIHRGQYGKYDCKVIYTSVLVETSDGKFAIGIMGKDTCTPEKLQLAGGGIDKEDINGDMLDLEHNIKKEISEELGIDINDKYIVKGFKPYLLKDGGKTNFLSAIFKLDLAIDADEFKDKFNKYNNSLIEQGISPELSSLLMLDADQHEIENFINSNFRETDENLIPTLKAAVGLVHVKTLF